MPITMEEYIRQAERRAVLRAPVEMRLEGIPAEQRLEGIPPEQLVDRIVQEAQALTPESREKLRQLLGESPAS